MKFSGEFAVARSQRHQAKSAVGRRTGVVPPKNLFKSEVSREEFTLEFVFIGDLPGSLLVGEVNGELV